MQKKVLPLLLIMLLLTTLFSGCISIGTPEEPTPTPQESGEPEGTNAPETVPYGNLQGNLNNGGFIVSNDTYVFYAKNGLWRMNQDGTERTKLLDGNFSALNLYEDKLYFLAYSVAPHEWGGLVVSNRQPFSMDLDGENLTTIGPLVEIREEDSYFWESEDGAASHTFYLAYEGFTVYDGYIYYLGNNQRKTTYTAKYESPDEENEAGYPETIEVTIESNTSLYRMDLDGKNATEIVKDLGNAYPLFSIDDGNIYYCTQYINPYYPYDFTTYNAYSIEDESITQLYGHKAEENSMPLGFSSEVGYSLDITRAIQGHDEKAYVSLGDSEGDFRDSRLTMVADYAKAHVVDEFGYVQSLIVGDELYYISGEREDIDAVTNRGLYKVSLEFYGLEGDMLFPLDFATDFDGMRLSYLDGYVYLSHKLLPLTRINAETGEAEMLSFGGEQGMVKYDEKSALAWRDLYLKEIDTRVAALEKKDDVVSFALYDMDGFATSYDYAPELLIQTEESYQIYSIKNGKVVLAGSIENAVELFKSSNFEYSLYAHITDNETETSAVHGVRFLEDGTLNFGVVLESINKDGEFEYKYLGKTVTQDEYNKLFENYCMPGMEFFFDALDAETFKEYGVQDLSGALR